MVRRSGFSEVRLSPDDDDAHLIPEEDTPFHIAILGDFSGRSSRGLIDTKVANRRVISIDRDTFDEALSRLKAEISLPIGGSAPLKLHFAELDDFHPDHLFENADIFRGLREVRLRLQDPATFAAAAEELGVRSDAHPAAKASAQPSSAGAVAHDLVHDRSGSLLDQIVDRTADKPSEGQSARPSDKLQEFVRRVTEPHLTAAVDSRQAEIIGTIDRALSAQMRALVQVPAFQALEAAWRAVFFLVRRIETGPQLKLYLIDISKAELAADLSSSQDFRASETYRLLVEKTVETPGAEPWAMIVGNYTFGPEHEDADLLGKFARIATAAGAPFIAAASSRLLGCASLSDTPHPRDWHLPPDTDGATAWSALRGLPEASAIGLALPRFLLRLPYGKKTDPIESFDFEEMPEDPSHEDYLWANPAFACAGLLAQSFSEYGWQMRPGVHAQIDGLPLHVYERDGESELKPCGEALLTEDAAEWILEKGLMPLVSLKRQDAVRLVRFQSIAEPVRALSGRWSRG